MANLTGRPLSPVANSSTTSSTTLVSGAGRVIHRRNVSTPTPNTHAPISGTAIIPGQSRVRRRSWTITHYSLLSPLTPDTSTPSTSHNLAISTHTQGPTKPSAHHPPALTSSPELNSTHSSPTNDTTDALIYYITLALLLAFTLVTLPLTFAIEASLFFIYSFAEFVVQLVIWPVLGLIAICLSYPWSDSKYAGATDAWLEADCFPPINHGDRGKGQKAWEVMGLVGSWGWLWVIVGVWVGIWWMVCAWKWYVIGCVVLVVGLRNMVRG